VETLGNQIVGAFYDVYWDLRPGFLESTYVRAMQIALRKHGIASQLEVPATVYFRGEVVGRYRMDLVVAGEIVVECKVADRLQRSNEAQLLHYLKATDYKVGMLLNFGAKPEFKRLIYETARVRDRAP